MYAERRGGTWRYEFVLRGRRHRASGFPTKRLAERAGEAARDALIAGRIERIWGVRDLVARDAAMPTLAEYVRDGYALHLPRLGPATQKTARSQLARLTRALGSYRLDEITPVALDADTADRLKAVSAAQVREEIERLSRVLNHARARGVLDAHPFRGWKRPRADRRDIRVVTSAEESQLLRGAPGDFADWIALGLDTGLRKGELRVLERETVGRRELRLKQGKTKRVKVIPLTPRAAAILARRLRDGRRYVLGQDEADRPWSLPWIDRRWQETCKAAGVTGIRFHDLRHTFATRLAERGVSVPVVGELLGHKAPYTTTLRYFHALPEVKRPPSGSCLGRCPPRSPPSGLGWRLLGREGLAAFL